MILALSGMDPTVAGIFFLIAVVLFGVAAWLARGEVWPCFIGVGLALTVFVFMWDRFALA